MKKNGIIVGIVLFIIALVVYWLATSIGGDKEEVEKPTATVTQKVDKPTGKPTEPQKVENNTQQGQEGKEQQTNLEPVTTQTPVQQVQPPTTTPQKTPSTFFKISDGDMGLPTGQFTEKMKTAKKNVTVLDYSPGTPTGKQMVYTVDLQGEKRDITIFVNGEVYYGLVIGRELSVTYSIYTNDSGIEFPVVDSVLEVIK